MKWYEKNLDIAGAPQGLSAKIVGEYQGGWILVLLMLNANNRVYVASEWKKEVGEIPPDVTYDEIREKYRTRLNKVTQHYEKLPYELWIKAFASKLNLAERNALLGG